MPALTKDVDKTNAVANSRLRCSPLAIVHDKATKAIVDATARRDIFHQSLLPKDEPMIDVKIRHGVNTCRTMFEIDTASMAMSFCRIKPTAMTMKTGRMTACKI